MGRGRPPVTRARVLGYTAKHWPCSVMQIVRATGAARSHVQRILRQSQGLKFPINGSAMNSLAHESFLVGGSSRDAPSDILEQRRAIRQMCGYITDDAKIARHHMVSIDMVKRVRASIPGMKRKGSDKIHTAGEGSERSSQRQDEAKIATGTRMLFEAICREHPWVRAA